MKTNSRQLVFMALLIALSFIGAQLKIFGSIAFDSLPAFLGTLLLGPLPGAIIASLGHLLTALSSGFPMTLPVHLVIALGMGLTMVATWYTFKFVEKISNDIIGLIVAVGVASLCNGPVILMFCAPSSFPSLLGLVSLLYSFPSP